MSNTTQWTVRAWTCALMLCSVLANAAPMARSDVPEPLKPWVPWVLHGAEQYACPSSFQQADQRACVWPSSLDLHADPQGAKFRLEVRVYGAPAFVELPGNDDSWPLEVMAGSMPLAVVRREQRPTVMLAPGRHVLNGRHVWKELPQGFSVPKTVGTLRVSIAGHVQRRVPDAEGRLWLREATVASAPANDAVSWRVARLVDDRIPMRVTTHLALSVAGKPREWHVPAALLPHFVAESIETALPARLNADGSLTLQLRAGQWRVSFGSRSLAPISSLTLPTNSLGEETWSFVAHNDLRILNVEGAAQIDPKQVDMPDEWRAHPAYRMRPGEALQLREARRGNPDPGPDKLSITREMWLDFDGGGYTMRDRIGGQLSRSWRLDVAAPAVLGRASVHGADQPITQAAGAASGATGIEVRHGEAAINADSRIDSRARELSATGWRADFEQATSTLHLPPGWRLLHAGGVDAAAGSWTSRWSLWDFFFVLIGGFAAGRLLGWRAGVLLGATLVVCWQLDSAPTLAWLTLLASIALTRALPAGKLRTAAQWGRGLTAAWIVLCLLPFAVTQVRHSLYPALELPNVELARDEAAPGKLEAAAPAAAPALAIESSALRSRRGAYDLKKATSPSPVRLDEIDPRMQVQTGPGVPSWRWRDHKLSWQGPVQAAQTLDLWLLPPAGTVAWRIGGLALLVASLIALLGGGWAGWRRGLSATTTVPVVLALLMSAMPDDTSGATTPVAAASPATASPPAPDHALLDELRQRLTAAPDCMPACADVGRLHVTARGSQIQLRLDTHAMSDLMLPLPGQGTNWRAAAVTQDGHPATLRRDEGGGLWIALTAGVSQVVVEGDVGDASNVEIALPLPARAIGTSLEGWTLAGADAAGGLVGALSLSRTPVAGAASASDGSTQRDALAPFVQVDRVLHLGLRWTMDTRITRIGASRAPAQVRVSLLPGESVNDATVRVADGVVTVPLGSEDTAAFTSTLSEVPQLTWRSRTEPNQIEHWSLDASTQWHVTTSGLTPVKYQNDGRWMPSWQPWPNEQVTLTITRPAGIEGQTLTIDALALTLTPGLRATDVEAEIRLRSSRGGNHRMSLPEGAEPTGLSIDGQPQPLPTLQGRTMIVPITPGAHRVSLTWREANGIAALLRTPVLDVGVPGVNETIVVNMPVSRVVLALGGPPVGPAVLFWGVLVALAGVSWVLGRSGFTPLRGMSWFLLGLGLAQTSLEGTVVVAGWFLLMAARQRHGPPPHRHLFIAWQLLLVLWTLIAAAVLLQTLHTGLLGHPDLLIAGNGSEAQTLRWYQDRYTGRSSVAWVFSAPLWAWRLAMLAWAAWLALALLRWVKWGWQCYSHGGHWPPKAVVVAPNP